MAATTPSSGLAGPAGLSSHTAPGKEEASKGLQLHVRPSRPSLPPERLPPAPCAFTGFCFPNSSDDRRLLAEGPSQSQAIG